MSSCSKLTEPWMQRVMKTSPDNRKILFMPFILIKLVVVIPNNVKMASNYTWLFWTLRRSHSHVIFVMWVLSFFAINVIAEVLVHERQANIMVLFHTSTVLHFQETWVQFESYLHTCKFQFSFVGQKGAVQQHDHQCGTMDRVSS